MPKSLVLTALISLGLGLVGQDPCLMTNPAPPPSQGACHETQDQDSAGTDDCDFGCQKACQPSMVLTSPLPAAGVLVPALNAARPLATRALPLVAHAIDHIPLA